MIPLLLATSNPAKLERLRWLVAGCAVRIQTPATLASAIVPTVSEDGPDFTTNAVEKARAWSAAADGVLTLASDGGLDIPALGDAWSALRTRRNAGPTASNAARIRHLLDLMRDLRGEDRCARWHEAIALARGGALLHSWTASADGGLIVEHYHDTGVDPAFWTESIRYYPSAGKVYRDLTDAELEALDGVWPRLRAEVRAYLREAGLYPPEEPRAVRS